MLLAGDVGTKTDLAIFSVEAGPLLKYMLKRFDHVSVEHVCSGIGIPNIYEYLRDIEHILESPKSLN